MYKRLVLWVAFAACGTLVTVACNSSSSTGDASGAPKTSDGGGAADTTAAVDRGGGGADSGGALGENDPLTWMASTLALVNYANFTWDAASNKFVEKANRRTLSGAARVGSDALIAKLFKIGKHCVGYTNLRGVWPSDTRSPVTQWTIDAKTSGIQLKYTHAGASYRVSVTKGTWPRGKHPFADDEDFTITTALRGGKTVTNALTMPPRSILGSAAAALPDIKTRPATLGALSTRVVLSGTTLAANHMLVTSLSSSLGRGVTCFRPRAVLTKKGANYEAPFMPPEVVAEIKKRNPNNIQATATVLVVDYKTRAINAALAGKVKHTVMEVGFGGGFLCPRLTVAGGGPANDAPPYPALALVAVAMLAARWRRR